MLISYELHRVLRDGIGCSFVRTLMIPLRADTRICPEWDLTHQAAINLTHQAAIKTALSPRLPLYHSEELE